MKPGRLALVSLLVSLVVWLALSWPLPLHLFEGIPSSSQNIEKGHVRAMIPGDHLQLLYQFWLAGDMVLGRTPLFYNLYEFNTGNDEARYVPKSYFVPFSLVYALGERLAGRAFGWNAAGFLSIWLTYLFTWLLARRYTRDEAAAACLSLISILLPFRWMNLLGGSPAGYAMMWVPALLLGLDLAIRDDRAGGGWLAGIAVLGTCLGDVQVFFYSVLAMPAWCVVALIAKTDLRPADLHRWLRMAVVLLPTALLGLLAVLYRTSDAGHPSKALAEAGRSLPEIAIFSPAPAGLFEWRAEGINSHIYLGWTILVLLGLGCALALFSPVRGGRLPVRSRILLVLLCVAAAKMIVLALGTSGPFNGLLLRAARKMLPLYTAVRQPAKILCLLPSFLSLACAVSAAGLLSFTALRRRRALFLAFVVAALAFELKSQVRATICLLDEEQRAYRSVAEDAAAQGSVPRALIIPLWPGDSSWASLYEFYVSLYRIRMMNGYHPAPPAGYMDGIFRRFDSANKGYLSDNQLNDLLGRGTRYVLLHEDAFPEKVSPFSVGFTLKRLMNHPRLEFIAQDGPVWAFRILSSPVQRPDSHAGWSTFSAARQWEVEKCLPQKAEIFEDPGAGNGKFARLNSKGAFVQTESTRMCGTAGLRYLVRLRGHGGLKATVLFEDNEQSTLQIAVRSSRWFWAEIPCEPPAGYGRLALKLERLGGTLDADMAVLSDQPPRSLEVGESWTWPAPCFFHAGFTDAKRDVVVLRADREPDDTVFYGPCIPLGPGTYEAEMRFASSAEPGTRLGVCRVDERGQDARVPAAAGEPARVQFDHVENLPVRLEFVFNRNADMEISEVVFTRIE